MTILKPTDKETSDVMKHLSKVSTLLKEDKLRWPRVIIRGVSSGTSFTGQTQRNILTQNLELGIDVSTEEEVFKLVFKNGPRDRSTTNWIVEVNPKYYGKFEDTTIFLGFMICRVSTYEEVIQRPNARRKKWYVRIAAVRGTMRQIFQRRKQTQSVLTAAEWSEMRF